MIAYNTENPKQDKAISALLICKTIAEAAQLAGVSERSLYNWLNDEGFSAAYRAARWTAAAQVITRLQQISSEAADALQDVFSNPEAASSARVAAAKAVIELSLRSVELESLEARISKLEEKELKAAVKNYAY